MLSFVGTREAVRIANCIVETHWVPVILKTRLPLPLFEVTAGKQADVLAHFRHPTYFLNAFSGIVQVEPKIIRQAP